MTVNISSILSILRIILFPLIIILCLVYSIPIILIRRFRHRANIFTVNICLATIGCSIYYIIFFIIYDYDIELMLIDNICNWLKYIRIVSPCQVSFAFVIVSINQFISMIYSSKPFFKTKRWVIICIIGQWVLGFIVSLPVWSRNNPVNIFVF
jgi:hypothetical protein